MIFSYLAGFAGLICGGLIAVAPNSKSQQMFGYFLASLAAIILIVSSVDSWITHRDQKTQRQALNAALDSGKCRLLGLEETNFGKNKVRYVCSDGVEVEKSVGLSQFKDLLERHQEQNF